MRFLIIGGSDAGISAAIRAHEVDPNAEVTVLLEDDFPNYSICGLPFYLSGETPRIDIFATALFHQMDVEELSDLDLSYTPPLSSPWDPVQMAAHHWCKTLDENVVEA